MDGANAMMSTGETVFNGLIGEELILSNTAFKRGFRYNLKTDQLKPLKTFTQNLLEMNGSRNLDGGWIRKRGYFEGS